MVDELTIPRTRNAAVPPLDYSTRNTAVSQLNSSMRNVAALADELIDELMLLKSMT
mgnify:CR=1 FL=1